MLIDSMHLKHRLCQIDPSCRNLHGDAPSQKWLACTSTLASRCRLRKGASIPLSVDRSGGLRARGHHSQAPRFAIFSAFDATNLERHTIRESTAVSAAYLYGANGIVIHQPPSTAF